MTSDRPDTKAPDEAYPDFRNSGVMRILTG